MKGDIFQLKVARAARPVFRKALCAVLHHQTRRRQRPGLRRDQAGEVRGELKCIVLAG